MPPRDDPYTVLGVSSDADADAIKKAYRKLALKWHPDKHTEEKDKEVAEKQFKKIAHAYETLTDSSKKSAVDRGARRRSRGAFPPDDFFRSPFEVFKEFFGNRDPFHDVFFDDAFAFPSESFLFKKHRFPSSRVHIFYNDKSPKEDNDCNYSTVIRFASPQEPGKNAQVRKTSTSTRMVDGKKVVTRKVENADEHITEVLEDGHLKSRIVNPVAVEAN